MSSLEAELSEVKLQTHVVEQENLLLKDELERLKQVSVLLECSEVQHHREMQPVSTAKRPSRRGWATSLLLQVADLSHKRVANSPVKQLICMAALKMLSLRILTISASNFSCSTLFGREGNVTIVCLIRGCLSGS